MDNFRSLFTTRDVTNGNVPTLVEVIGTLYGNNAYRDRARATEFSGLRQNKRGRKVTCTYSLLRCPTQADKTV